jgi:hypothetical protein
MQMAESMSRGAKHHPMKLTEAMSGGSRGLEGARGAERSPRTVVGRRRRRRRR